MKKGRVLFGWFIPSRDPTVPEGNQWLEKIRQVLRLRKGGIPRIIEDIFLTGTVRHSSLLPEALYQCIAKFTGSGSASHIPGAYPVFE